MSNDHAIWGNVKMCTGLSMSCTRWYSKQTLASRLCIAFRKHLSLLSWKQKYFRNTTNHEKPTLLYIFSLGRMGGTISSFQPKDQWNKDVNISSQLTRFKTNPVLIVRFLCCCTRCSRGTIAAQRNFNDIDPHNLQKQAKESFQKERTMVLTGGPHCHKVFCDRHLITDDGFFIS